MVWFKVDDKLHDHRKARVAQKAAIGVWTLAGSWSSDNLTDGFVPESVLMRWGTKADARRLVEAGLWCAVDGGWQMVRDGVWTFERGRKRPWIPSTLRSLIYDRDGRKCVECASTHDLTLDHIFPWSRGGQDDASNLRTLCRPCNSRKGARV